jgi:predicted nucleic acid-binding protein
MRIVFADSFFWMAPINPKDEWHFNAIGYQQKLAEAQIVTTQEVLTEYLTYFSGWGSYWRQVAARLVDAIEEDPSIEVITQSELSFAAGLELYRARADKDYSMVDCISMQTMQEMEIAEVLTLDHHFAQEGFVVLFAEDE